MEQTDYAWVAGLVEGDGYVGIVRLSRRRQMKSPHFQIQMGITNTELALVKRTQEILGGYIRTAKAKNTRQGFVYRWMTSSAQMLPSLEKIVPYMVGRKGKIAEKVITFQKDTQRIFRDRINMKRKRGWFIPLPAEEVKRREKLWEEIKILNEGEYGIKPRRKKDSSG